MDIFGLSAAQIDSAGAHWTAREVLQQPQIWAQIDAMIAAEGRRLAAFLDPLLKVPELRIVLTGAGTSAHIGACLAPALARHQAHRVDAIPTTDLVASPRSYLGAEQPTLLVSFGRSGNSPESVAAVEIADASVRHCAHLIFTCDAGGALYKRGATASNTCVVLLPEASNDRSFAMTSSFTGMLFAAALAFGIVQTGGARSAALAYLAQQVLPAHVPLLQSLAGGNFARVVYLGSKEFTGLARESRKLLAAEIHHAGEIATCKTLQQRHVRGQDLLCQVCQRRAARAAGLHNAKGQRRSKQHPGKARGHGEAAIITSFRKQHNASVRSRSAALVERTAGIAGEYQVSAMTYGRCLLYTS